MSGHESTDSPPKTVGEVTWITTSRLGAVLTKYVSRHLPPTSTAKQSAPKAIVTSSRPTAALKYVKVVPWILGLLFAVSFVWDLDGLTLVIGGTRIPLEGLLLVVSASGFIGFGTNWLAISMLFRPRQRRPLFGQGLIPAQREHFVERLTQAVSQKLINEDMIRRRIKESGSLSRYRNLALTVTQDVCADEDFRAEIKALASTYLHETLSSDDVRTKIAEFAVEKLEEANSLAIKAYRYFNKEAFRSRVDSLIKELPRSVDFVLDEMDTVLDRLPSRIAQQSEDIEEWASKLILGFVGTLDIHGVIATNLQRYDEMQLDLLIHSTTNEQLNYIKYLGGILGMVGGLVIFEPILAAAFLGTIILVLVGLDSALLRLRRS